MTKKLSIAAVLLAPAAYFIYASSGAPGPMPGEPSQDILKPAFELPLLTKSVRLPETPPAESATEIVLGIPVRKDRDCRVELKDYVTPDGEMFSAYSCTPNKFAAAHRYAEYDNETLSSLAYADADAAALLGHRLIDRDTGRSYELLIRASALDGGNIEHLAWLSDQAFGIVAIDGKPQLLNLQRQYELAALATHLGGNPGRAAYLRNELSENGVEESQMNSMHQRVNVLLETMREIQRTVIGAVTIGGRDDA